MIFIASGALFLLIGLGVLRQVFGVSLREVINSARGYAVKDLGVAVWSWSPWAALPMCRAAWLLHIRQWDPYVRLVLVYVPVSIIGALVFAGGAGVDANVFFDADIALALSAGLLIDRVGQALWAAVAALLYAIPLFCLLPTITGDWSAPVSWLRPRAADSGVAAAEIALLRSQPDPVLCEVLSLCYWSGKSPQVAINEGYERAFATILDSNVTTLIAGLALLAFGSGPVRGFAVVHCLGIVTSMFSSVVFSRGIVNLWYGRQKKLKGVAIGQVWKPPQAEASTSAKA